jgi:glycerol uptake facilitator-like aquaporin
VAVAEFVATFTLIFIGAGAVVLNAAGNLDLTGVALAHGLALAIMVSITMHISGGLVNPAVAISLWVTGKLPSTRAVVCIVAELLGAVAGALLLKALIPRELFDVGHGGVPVLGDTTAVGKGILIEATTTFFLVFAVFGTAVAFEVGILGIEGRWDATHVGFDAAGARYDFRPTGPSSPALAGSLAIGDGRFDLRRLDLVSVNLRVRTPGFVGFIASGGLSYLPDIQIEGSLPIDAQLLGLPVLPSLQPRLALVATPEQAAHRWGVNGGAGIRVGGRLSFIAEARLFYFGSYDLHFVMDDPFPLVNDLVAGIGTIRFNPIILNAQAGLTFRF